VVGRAEFGVAPGVEAPLCHERACDLMSAFRFIMLSLSTARI
jgi:hypothetical protein